MVARPRIVLLHATPVAIEPIRTAFAALWPEPFLVDLLDDSLSPDRAASPDLTPALVERFVALGRYAHSTGADAILVTCSAFGPAIERLADELPIPVLKPNEAMFHAAVSQGRAIGMVATFAPSLVTMQEEFDDYVAAVGSPATLTSVVAHARALPALKAGDADTHNRLVVEAVPRLGAVDLIMLAHFSTSRAEQAVQAQVAVPVLSAPTAAVRRLRELVVG